MSAEANRMTCPECGVEMNHHANKIDYSAAPEDGGAAEGRLAMTEELGGVVIETHACPLCGGCATRPAAA
ncbi:MAG TPA: hypothetical protein VEQ42_11385 [Pyrinomonadaceae bacterium]|nr:hypothetical protein [Pyrinomonadaceae bacterium]